MWNLLEQCEGADVIVITGHVRPDGDCVGSVMAIYRYLRMNLPSSRVFACLERPASAFDCIEDVDQIISDPDRIPRADLCIVADCGKDRIGPAYPLYEAAERHLNIDHHISSGEGCGEVNYVDPSASSTAELVFDLMDPDRMDTQTAKAIYIGIMHDTGVFRYSNTTPKTMRTLARLLEFDFDFTRLIDETFYEKTYEQNQILGRALLESFRFMDDRCIVSAVSQKTMEFFGVKPEDLDGIVGQLRVTKGVECAIFLYQTGAMEYKVSLRSNSLVDVSQVAVFFGGGGHLRAAGCTMTGTAHDVINNLAAQIAKQLDAKSGQCPS